MLASQPISTSGLGWPDFNNYLYLVNLQRGWQVGSDGYLHFEKDIRKGEDVGVPSQDLAQQMITYAREMEQIVWCIYM